jgi:hypothetical protein
MAFATVAVVMLCKTPFGTLLKLERIQEKMSNAMHFVTYLIAVFISEVWWFKSRTDVEMLYISPFVQTHDLFVRKPVSQLGH